MYLIVYLPMVMDMVVIVEVLVMVIVGGLVMMVAVVVMVIDYQCIVRMFFCRHQLVLAL